MNKQAQVLAYLCDLSKGKPVESCYFEIATELDGDTRNLIAIQSNIQALIADKKIKRFARPDNMGNLYIAPYGGE